MPELVIHSYSSIIVSCQNARTYIIYGNVNELYELEKFIGLCTLCIIIILVELKHQNNTKKNKKKSITGKSSNVIKIRVKTVYIALV